jgi:hypothetical protein
MRNTGWFSFSTMVVILLLTGSCIDQLDFIGNTEEGQLVIYGLVTDSDEIHKVTISETQSFSRIPKGIAGARVTLKDGQGVIRFFQDKGNGDYELEGVVAQAGSSYKLEIELEGKSYESEFEVMPTLSANDELSYTIATEPINGTIARPVMTLYSETTLPATDAPIYLRWKVRETYLWQLVWVIPESGFPPPPPPNCFISSDLDANRLNLFDGSNSTSLKTEMVMSKRHIDNSFISPYNLSVTQLSTTRGAYEYWEQIKIMLDNQGSLFDVPPATVKGNMSNTDNPDEKVLGYFEVAKTKITRLYTFYSDIPFYLLKPCDYIRGKAIESYPSECHSCAVRAGSKSWTNERPSWWFAD